MKMFTTIVYKNASGDEIPNVTVFTVIYIRTTKYKKKTYFV